MKLKQLLMAALALAVCVSCSKNSPDITGDLVGIITSARTGEPLPGVGVTVTPGGMTVTTGADGRFEFQALEAGNYTVQAKKADYQTDQKTVAISVGERSNLSFQLTPSTSNLAVSHNTIDFGSDKTTNTLDLTNNGNAPLNWSVSEDADWINCVPSSGIIQAGERASVVINVDCTGKPKGAYSQNVAIASNGGSAIVVVSMSVQNGMVAANPDELDFGTISSVLPLSLRNITAASTSYTAQADRSWITVTPTRGNIAGGATAQLQVSVNRANLSANLYEGSITVQTGEDIFNIPVRMTIASRTLPQVFLHGVGSVTHVSADFHAALTSLGGSVVKSYGFVWGKEPMPELGHGLNYCNLGESSQLGDYAFQPQNLDQNTTYYVRAYAENEAGVAYSEQQSFQTTATPTFAQVVTGELSNLTATSVDVSGQLVTLGGSDVTSYGHILVEAANPQVPVVVDNGRAIATGRFASRFTGLKPNTRYLVQAFAVNETGPSYANIVEFTTLGREPRPVDITFEERSEEEFWGR